MQVVIKERIHKTIPISRNIHILIHEQTVFVRIVKICKDSKNGKRFIWRV